MAFSYISADRDQLFLLPPSMSEWLEEGHLAWFVLDVVALVDTSAFHARHRNDGAGRPAWDPEVLLALLVYAYCVGMRSSRRIEAACRSDVAFRVICANRVPDHGSIARFRAGNEAAIEAVFADILGLCAEAGLANLGVIAIDGTKIGSDAALDANRRASSIRDEVAKMLAEAAAADRQGPAQLGLGGELPANLARRGSRRARLQAALEQVEAQEAHARAEAAERAEKANAEAAQGRKLRGRKPKDPHAALARAEADVAATRNKAEATGTKAAADALAEAEARLGEARQAVEEAPAPEEPRVNVTDPESRMMKTPTGFVQGYNAQAAVNDRQVVMAASVTQDHNDVGQLRPLIDATTTNATAAGAHGEIGLVLADTGYWSEDNATAPGPERLIATSKDWKQRKAAREMGTTQGPPPEGASPLEAMEHRLRTEQGAAAYARRSCIVEPVFGQHKENRGFRRFMRRGLGAAQSEWSLICATGNLLKLFAHADGRSLNTLLATT